jgi:hypothetical protein
MGESSARREQIMVRLKQAHILELKASYMGM